MSLSFTGHSYLRHRLVLSLLSRKTVKITQIRPDDEAPGLTDYEVSFLRLIEKLTQGSRLEISYTGTSILFVPGLIRGGPVSHTCPVSRSVGWFLEPVLALAPFGKAPLRLTLTGLTSDGRDAGVDTIRTAVLPELARFLSGDASGDATSVNASSLELRILRRGLAPLGGGQVAFTCPNIRRVTSGLDLTTPGRVLKIRGIAHCVRVSPQMANRLVAAARGVLNRYVPDVYIYTDVYKGGESGKSPGFGLALVSESSEGVRHSAEGVSGSEVRDTGGAEQDAGDASASSTSHVNDPEELATLTARQLLAEIARGGCVDAGAEWLVALLLALGSEDLGRVRVAGPLSPRFVQFLRDLRSFLGVTFGIKEVAVNAESGSEKTEESQYILSCVGIGYTNTAKKVT